MMEKNQEKSGLKKGTTGSVEMEQKHPLKEENGIYDGKKEAGKKAESSAPQKKTGTGGGRENRVKMADLVALQKKAGWLGDRKGPDKMAELIALHRVAESSLPEGRRIFFDPYAIRFIDPDVLEWGRTHPEDAKALAEEFNKKMPGFSNSIRARVRYFDDSVRDAAGLGFSQLVILGAGYDTRAYRIDTVRDRIRVFEVDHPVTQRKKTETLARIFNGMPENVVFVPVELEREDLWDAMEWYGYSPVEKTLFLMEGLLMYLSREYVRDLLSGIVEHTIDGSAILFDFLPRSLAEENHDAEGGKEILDYTVMAGEPLRSGFSDAEIIAFLSGLGYSRVKITGKSEYSELYFTGINSDRPVSGLMSFASAFIRGTGRKIRNRTETAGAGSLP